MSNNHQSIKGLTLEKVDESRRKFGNNILTPPARDPWWKLLLEKFDDPIIRILIIAAGIAVIVGFFHGNFIEGIGIIIAILLATLMAFFNEFRAGLEFDILNKVSDRQPVKVMRNGGVTAVPISDIVVGDVVIVDTGEEVPADGRIISSISLGVNESTLTGELLVYKHANADSITEEHTYPSNMLYRGTTIMEGNATFEVTAVGNSTEIGKTAREASIQINDPTPLSLQLERLSKLIGVVGFSVAFIAFWGFMLFDYFSGKLVLRPHNWFSLFAILIPLGVILVRVWLPIVLDLLQFLGKPISPPQILSSKLWKAFPKLFVGAVLLFAVFYGVGQLYDINLFSATAWFSIETAEQILLFILVAITLIVVAVPEGLAMSVTLSLAYSMRKMTATNNLVRRMQATETMGATTVICTDKTGTLTQNQMQVVSTNFFVDKIDSSTKVDSLIAVSMAVNSKAFLDTSGQSIKPLGNPTDAALLLWLNQHDEDYEQLRSNFSIVTQIPFSSETKFMATAGTAKQFEQSVILLKGAPEIVKSKCTHFLAAEGELPIDRLSADQYDSKIAELQSAAMRTIAFAYRFVESEAELEKVDKTSIDQMVLLGFVGIADPIRHDVPNAINECKLAGVDVKIVTGDTSITAKEICCQIGLCARDSESGLISGTEFAEMSDKQALELLPKLKVMYRARPTDKLKLVRLLQQSGEVVAVTGDGTNDAPALNKANVGLSMGSGTSVAKEASDIILLDDSFTSIVNAIRWGRSLYQNIQRFLFFQLTINLLALAIVLLGPIVGVTLPLTVIQMLWVNLIMDTFAALALATEPPHEEVMKQKPRKTTDFIISQPMQRWIAFSALSFFVILMVLLSLLNANGDISVHELTIFFNVFVMLQFWNLFNAKAMGSGNFAFSALGKSLSFFAIAIVILVGQVLIVQLGGNFFRTVPLSLANWLTIFFSTSLVLVFGEIYRFIFRKRTR